MRVLFTQLAHQELQQAMQYYELEFTGLGRRFEHEVTSAIRRIAAFPHAWSIERGEIRKYPLLKFPYKLLYAIEAEGILILAIAHMHRQPDYWID